MDHDNSKADAVDLARLDEKVKGIKEDVLDIKKCMTHLDECIDKTQVEVAFLHNAMKLFHSPAEWAKENWFGATLVLFIFGALSSLPNVAISKVLGFIFHG